jgi:ribosomal protein S12 methylthiotransferase
VELILIAQDTTFYGLDLYKKQKIVDLLYELESINGLKWIRIHYAYPTTFQNELIEFIANSKKLVSYIDLPIQHISDNVLRMMKRGGTSYRIKNIFSELRKRIPDVALRSTLIVGHPGETEKDYKLLKDFVQEIQFDRLGVFKYSAEENTAAFNFRAPLKEKTDARYSELMEIQKRISFKKNRKKIGKTFEVLIDEVMEESKTAIGRTFADSPEIDNEVIIENFSILAKPGNFYNVKINSSSEYELFGEILEEK